MGVNPLDENYVKLKKINKIFCIDAKEIRWQAKKGFFTKRNINKRYPWSVRSVGWLRTITSTRRNLFLFFIDVDGSELNEETLSAAFRIHDALEKITSHKPVIKASGKAGAHIYLKMQFPHNYTERHIFKKMKDLAYTCYLKSGIEKDNFLIGPYKKEEIDGPGFIDTRVYRSDGMVRGFSLHPGSGFYSVPIERSDDLATVKNRMILSTDVPDVRFEVAQFNPRWDLDQFEEADLFEGSPDEEGIDFEALKNMVPKYRGDEVWDALPPQLKAVVRMGNDINHDMKWPLIQHLYYYENMSPKEVFQWIWDNANWSDLKSKRKTFRQVNSTIKWTERHKYPLEYMGIDFERPPLRRKYYD